MICNSVLATVLFFSVSVLASESRHRIGVGGSYGLSQSGIIQVRENEVIGDRLRLVDDLGLDQFVGLSLSYGYKLKAGWLDVSYTQYLLEGKDTFASNFYYNGATYAPGQTDISKTKYRRATIVYRHLLEGERESLDRWLVGGGVVIETLKFYIDGELDSSTTRSEKFESFDSQTMPVPAAFIDWHRSLKENFGYGFEASFAWLPKVKTPYKEKGNIYFEQTNFDLKAQLNWVIDKTHISGGYYFKYFMQKGESREDTNEFQISSSGLFAEAQWFF